MKTTGHRLLLVLAVAALAAGCTDDADATRPSRSATSPPAGSPTPVVQSGSGEYRYENEGLVATLDLDDGTGTLEIQNQTGRELPEPDFYILDARDGRRVEATVQAAAPIPSGENSSFEVAFEGIEIKNIGLVVLLLGTDNYGGFVPQ